MTPFKDLKAFGLTHLQSKIYTSLLCLGNARARDISSVVGTHRVEVYRNLREMGRMQLVEVSLGSPNIYRAVDPCVAIENLCRNLEDQTKATLATKSQLIESLNLLSKSTHLAVPSVVQKYVTYRLITGRGRFYREVKNLMSGSTREVLRIISGKGIIRLARFGLFDEYVKCYRRGVKTRLICKIDRNNVGIIKKFLNVAEIRHSNDAIMRFLVSDRRSAAISASFDDNNMSADAPRDIFLLTNDEDFARSMGYLFDQAWRSSGEAEIEIRKCSV